MSDVYFEGNLAFTKAKGDFIYGLGVHGNRLVILHRDDYLLTFSFLLYEKECLVDKLTMGVVETAKLAEYEVYAKIVDFFLKG